MTATVTYSLSQYDKDGDEIEHGVFLYFDHNVAIRVCESVEDFDAVLAQLVAIRNEIQQYK